MYVNGRIVQTGIERILMASLAKANKALKDLRLLKEQGFAVKDEAIALLQGKVWEAGGLRQIWFCPECPGTKLEMYIPASQTICGLGHVMRLLWESSTTLANSLVGQVLDQHEREPLYPQPHQQNSEPLLDTPGKLILPALSPLPSLRKIGD
jgi:hypothetical protein